MIISQKILNRFELAFLVITAPLWLPACVLAIPPFLLLMKIGELWEKLFGVTNEWRDYYAWWPTEVWPDVSGRVWLQTIQRRRYHGGIWYRLKPGQDAGKDN